MGNDLRLPVAPTPNPAAIALAERTLVDAVAARPRVRAVATASDHPLAANWSESLTIVGDGAASEQRRQVELWSATSDFAASSSRRCRPTT